MHAMWAIPKGRGGAGDGGENTLAEVRKMREEWDENRHEIEKLRDECRGTRQAPEEPKP
jgi:hypothetical protein